MEKVTTQKSSEEGNLERINDLALMCEELGKVHYKQNSYEKALVFFEESLKFLDTLYKNLDKGVESNKDAVFHLESKILELKKIVLEILNKLGDLKFRKSDFHGALENYKTIVLHGINSAFIYCKISQCLYETGDHLSAINFLKKVLTIEPENANIYRNIADIYNNDLKMYEDAIFYYKKFIENESEDNQAKAEVYNLIGHLYETISQYGTVALQIENFEKALEFSPNFHSVLQNLTVVYPRAGRYEDALECFKKIFKIGASMDNYYDYACLNIKLKNFEEGWKFFEHRFAKENDQTVYPNIEKPKWEGQDIKDKTLLVQYEQGFGDSIMFFRYLFGLKKVAKKIIFRVQDDLLDLLALNAKRFEVVGMSTPLNKIEFDYHLPLMSVVNVLKQYDDNFPFKDGYIKADIEKTKKYKSDFFDNDCFKIGISWHGSTSGNSRRDIPLETFFQLANLKNVKIYLFQKDITDEELNKIPRSIDFVNLGSEFQDFSDTAAAMANLDLFITSDNSVLNLAGAMGKKTFLLLNKDSEWRWFSEEKHNPWYSSVEIFKKKDENDGWELLIDRIVKKLSKGLNC